MNKQCIFVAILAVVLLQGCRGESEEASGFSSTDQTELADAKAFKSSSPYARIIGDCIRAENSDEYCRLSTLPLLGMETDSPTIEDVMNRLVVSHDWMGERFEALLQRYPSEILYLFRGVTAVVIDADIRPAFYTSGTGAIYIDPAYLWLSNQEKATINQKQDFRSGFSDPLDFRSVNRYVNGNEPAYAFYSLSGSEERSLDDIELLFARLLLHELAHANDFFPPSHHASINAQQTTREAAIALQADSVSNLLYEEQGLSSNRLFSLAGVMYIGREPTTEDLGTTAAVAGAEFEADSASDDYAYTSKYEDVAMLFEVTMMKYFWGVDYDTGFVDVPTGSCSEAPVVIGWAQRARIGEPNVKQRAKYVSDRLLGEVDLTDFYENLAAANDFVPGSNWCQQAELVGSESSQAEKLQLKLHDDNHQHHDHPYYQQALETFKPYL